MNTQIELTDLLAGFAAARDEAAAPDGAVRVPVITARVRRRRVVRTVAASGLAAAAVVGIAAGVYGLTRPDPTPPVDSPTPTVTPTPTPTPTPTEAPTQEPTAEPPQPLGDVTVHPLLPTAEPLLEGMLEETTAAWSMVTYVDGGVADGEAEDHPAVLYLVAPDGSLFEVPTPVPLMAPCDFCGSGEGAGAASVVTQWLPGTPLAIVTPVFDDVDVSRHYQVTDLLTGDVLQSVDAAPDEWLQVSFVRDGTSDVLLVRTSPGNDLGGDGVRSFERRHADGTVTASFSVDPADRIVHFVIDAQRRRVVLQGPDELRILDLKTLSEEGALSAVAFDGCQPDFSWDFENGRPLVNHWLDADTLVLGCAVGEPTVGGSAPMHLWLLDLDGTEHDLGGGHPEYGLAVLDGRLLVADVSTWYEVLLDGSRSGLSIDTTVSFERAVDGRLVYVDRFGAFGGEGVPAPTGNLVWVEPFAGARGVLLELVDPGSQIEATT